MTDKRVDKVKQVEAYMRARLANEIPKCMALVTDDIRMFSAKDGTFKGIKEFEQYLKTTKPTGQFDKPVANGDTVDVNGNVRVFGMKIGVTAKFQFRNGQISDINIGRS